MIEDNVCVQSEENVCKTNESKDLQMLQESEDRYRILDVLSYYKFVWSWTAYIRSILPCNNNPSIISRVWPRSTGHDYFCHVSWNLVNTTNWTIFNQFTSR